MKLSFAVFCALAFGVLSDASAQLRDDEQSAQMLAMQCTISSGFRSSNYADYAERLAKTLGNLPPAAQQRVFGYLPQPSLLATSGFSGGSEGGTGADVAASTDASGSSPDTTTGGLADGTSDTGTSGTTDATSGGTAGTTGDMTADTSTGTGADTNDTSADATGGDASSGWLAFLSWLDSLFN